MRADESRAERVTRFSKIWWKSRADAGKSQEFMALSLGVSKKTILNWERGLSAPNLFQRAEWFRVLGLNPTHYHLEYLYPDAFGDATTANNDARVEETLVSMIKNATAKEKKTASLFDVRRARQLLVRLASAIHRALSNVPAVEAYRRKNHHRQLRNRS